MEDPSVAIRQRELLKAAFLEGYDAGSPQRIIPGSLEEVGGLRAWDQSVAKGAADLFVETALLVMAVRTAAVGKA